MSYKKFTKDIWIIGLTNTIIALRGLILLPIITKILGESNYGIWVQIIAILPLVALMTTLGLPYTLVRFLAGEKDKKQFQDGFYSVMAITLCTTILLSSMLFFGAARLSVFLQWPTNIIKILAIITLFECVNFLFLHLFRASQKINLYSFFILLQTIGEILFTVAAVLLGYGLSGAIVALLLVRIINFFISGTLAVRQIGFALPYFSKTKEYLRFGMPTIPGNISNWTVGFSDRYLIGYFLGLSFVAYYGPACTLAGVMGFLGAPFSFLLPATLSRLHSEGNIQDVKKYLSYSLKYFLAVAIPAFFGISILSKKILLILSTQNIADNGYFLVPLVTFGMLLYGIYGIIYLILILEKKTLLVTNIWIAAALLNFALNYFFISRIGIVASAIINLFTYAFIVSLTWHRSRKYLTFHIDWIFIQKSVAASLAMSACIFFVNPKGLMQILMSIVIGAIIYGSLLLLLKSFKQRELNFFKSLVTKKAS